MPRTASLDSSKPSYRFDQLSEPCSSLLQPCELGADINQNADTGIHVNRGVSTSTTCLSKKHGYANPQGSPFLNGWVASAFLGGRANGVSNLIPAQ